MLFKASKGWPTPKRKNLSTAKCRGFSLCPSIPFKQGNPFGVYLLSVSQKTWVRVSIPRTPNFRSPERRRVLVSLLMRLYAFLPVSTVLGAEQTAFPSFATAKVFKPLELVLWHAHRSKTGLSQFDVGKVGRLPWSIQPNCITWRTLYRHSPDCATPQICGVFANLQGHTL